MLEAESSTENPDRIVFQRKTSNAGVRRGTEGGEGALPPPLPLRLLWGLGFFLAAHGDVPGVLPWTLVTLFQARLMAAVALPCQ